MKLTELKPIYDSRKSFYHKAFERTSKEGIITLYSFETPVAKLANGHLGLNLKIKKSLLFSQTTVRHIKEFVRQHTGKTVTTKYLKEVYEN